MSASLGQDDIPIVFPIANMLVIIIFLVEPQLQKCSSAEAIITDRMLQAFHMKLRSFVPICLPSASVNSSVAASAIGTCLCLESSGDAEEGKGSCQNGQPCNYPSRLLPLWHIS